MNDIGNRLSFLALRVGSRLLAVPQFYKDLIELTGYTLDRWDLHGNTVAVTNALLTTRTCE